MAGILSFPFRLDPRGYVATTPYGSDREVDEAIAILVQTDIGERPLSPEFGIPDPAGLGINEGDIQTGLDTFGPENVTITTVTQTPINDTQSEAKIEWDWSNDPGENNLENDG